jgi:hypothetical protein
MREKLSIRKASFNFEPQMCYFSIEVHFFPFGAVPEKSRRFAK